MGGRRRGVVAKTAQARELTGCSGAHAGVRPAEAVRVADGAPARHRARKRDTGDDDGGKAEHGPRDARLPFRKRASKGCRSALSHQSRVGGATARANPLNGWLLEQLVGRAVCAERLRRVLKAESRLVDQSLAFCDLGFERVDAHLLLVVLGVKVRELRLRLSPALPRGGGL